MKKIKERKRVEGPWDMSYIKWKEQFYAEMETKH